MHVGHADALDGAPMIDLVFELIGESLPAGYPSRLWRALSAALPALEPHEDAGLLPVRGLEPGAGGLLSRRARLTLRVPDALAGTATALAGTELVAEGLTCRIGAVRHRGIAPAATLKAAFVVSGEADELMHHRQVVRMLAARGLPDRVIFGRMGERELEGARVAGSSVVIHQLRPGDSLRLQHHGLGPHRHHGCGLFVPYKDIAGLD